MERIGISFFSTMTPDEVRERVTRPLRAAIDRERVGVFSNYLHQDAHQFEAAEHLLMFEVWDFRAGLRLLRTEWQSLEIAADLVFHNLNASDLPY